MTGFGRGERQVGAVQVTADVRSVNHRFLDVRVKLPPAPPEMEVDLRKRVSRAVNRGRVELAVNVRRNGQSSEVRVNTDMVAGYVAAARQIRRATGLDGEVPLAQILQLPGVIRVESAKADLNRKEVVAASRAVDQALSALDEMRAREGMVLGKDLLKRLQAIGRASGKIRRRAAGASQRRAQRLQKRVQALADGVAVDPARLAQEVALLADRSDIEEELVRLDAHLDAMTGLVQRDKGPWGKELDFLTQELLRETNTIHSKAADLTITRGALGIKAEIEKIREQVQNVE